MTGESTLLQQAWRVARRQPAFLILAAVTLSVGIGALVAAATLVDALVVGAPPFSHHGHLVAYGQRLRDGPELSISPSAYDAIGTVPGMVSRGIARPSAPVNVRYENRTYLLRGQRISGGFLATLGITPVLGRIKPEAQARPGVWISHHLWSRVLQGEADIVGRRIVVDGESLPVMGVLPASYRFSGDVDLLLPWQSSGPVEAKAPNMVAVAWLAADSAPSIVTSEIVARLERLPHALGPADRAGWFGVATLDHVLTERARALVMLFLSCGLVLLALAGVNVSNLMRTRALGRMYDVAIREALGVSEGWHWSPGLLEGLLIGTVAALGGMGLGALLVRMLREQVPEAWRISALPIEPDWTMQLLACGASALVVALASLVASQRLRTKDIVRERLAVDGWPSASRAARRARGIFVLLQVALATALLFPAMASMARLKWLERVPLGFATSHAVAIELLPDARQFPTVADIGRLLEALRPGLAALPGVDDVGLSSYLPVGAAFVMPFRQGDGSKAMWQYALLTSGAAQAMGLDKRGGRWFDDNDRAGTEPVAMVNEAYLRAAGGGGIGSQVFPASSLSPNIPWRIVGIVADTRHAGADLPASPTVFLPFAQANDASFAFIRQMMPNYLVIRGPAVDASMEGRIRSIVQAAMPDLAPGKLRDLDGIGRIATDAPRRLAFLITVFAVPAVLLAGVGLYSVQAIEVSTRRHDLALTAALGAHPSALLGRVLLRGVCLSGLGIVVGLLGASLLREWWQADALDPEAIVAAALAMLLVTIGATAIPACRALTVEPWRILRGEV